MKTQRNVKGWTRIEFTSRGLPFDVTGRVIHKTEKGLIFDINAEGEQIFIKREDIKSEKQIKNSNFTLKSV